MAKTSFIEQLKNIFIKLTFLQKIIIAGAIFLVTIGFIVLLNNSMPNHEYSVLFSNLESADAAQIVKKLKDKQIDYVIEDNGTTILVDKKTLYETRLQLASEGLPENSTVGYEIFDKANLGMSEFVQKLNYRRALEGELARTISSIDEIKKARVHIVIPERALFEKDQKVPTASVQLHLRSGRRISRLNTEGIQNLISSSIEGLSPNNVTIVDQKGKILSEQKTDEKSVAGMSSQQHEQQKKVDQYLTSKIKNVLDGVLGSENTEVTVNTELDFTQIEKTITDFNPEKQIARNEQNSNDNSMSSDTNSTPAIKMSRSQTNAQTSYEIPKTVERIVQGVGNVKRITAAVLVNHSKKFTDKNGQKTHQMIPRTDDELQKLTQIVRNSIGYDPSRNDQVTVINVPFDTTYTEEEAEAAPQPEWYSNPDLIKLFLLILSMLAIIFLMYRILHSRQVRDRLRIALSLPGSSEERGLLEGAKFGTGHSALDEIMIGDDQVLMLPAELPEPLMLESDKGLKKLSDGADEDALYSPRGTSRGDIQDFSDSELAEDILLKSEIRNKVQEYLDQQTSEAVKILRFYILQDSEERISRY